MAGIIDLVTSSNPIVGIVGDVAGKLIDRIWPDKVAQAAERAKAEQELMLLAQEDKLDERAKDTQIALAQIAVNQVEAASTNWFTSNWRPFVGWTGASALAYSSIIEPMARFIASVGFGYSGAFPVIDTNITMQILFGLLGIGAMRSYDKKQGTTS